ncbi:MAG TPA: OmpA family protein [Prolixibacteraceae bacterium]|nr:OmpA family protein [Prolixibacteraceae bacterium]
MKIFFAISIMLFCLSFRQATSSDDKKLTKLFEQAKLAYSSNQFSKSLSLLDDVLAIDSSYLDVYLLKSDIYQELDSIVPQINSIEAALQINSEKYPKLYYLLGNAYYRTGIYEKALGAYQAYLDRVDDKASFVNQVRQNINKCTQSVFLQKHPVPFSLINLGANINSEDNEYWPSLTVDGETIIFTRLVGSKNTTRQQRALIQEDFYTSHLENNIWQPCEAISTINTIDNEGAQTISADGKLLFFTACARNDSKGSCDIYFSRNKAGIWSAPQNAGEPVNSPSWESMPSISANGKTIYFVSNRKGGKGGMDIWKCNLLEFSEWGTPIWGYPVNLGDSVNTPGNEMSPFIHADGKTIYFASDYWPGMGGFDIFYCRQKNDSVWSRPQNIGYPINSYKNEQGLVVDASGEKAYYSSDRPGSKGMDIYSFELYPDARPAPVSYIKGKVVDEDTGAPLCAKVELIDLQNPKSVITSESCGGVGEFLMCLPLGSEYAFNVSKEGYLFYSENFQLKEKKEIIDPYILEIKMKKIKIGGSVVLRNIFFSTGSYELLSESKIELQELTDFLNLNRILIIEIGGHTDDVGSAAYNQELSESRAKEVYKYLIGIGIPENRMKYNGYGLSVPVCPNDTPEGRALNRRTEFKIIKN